MSSGVWLLNSQGVWSQVAGTPLPGVGLTTPIFSTPASGQQLASYWRTSPTSVTLYSTTAPTDGAAPPGFSPSTTSLPNPLTFRVRPDQNGQSGVIAGSFNIDGEACSSGSQAVFARISSQTAAPSGGNVGACDMLVASSEDQTALLVWRVNQSQPRAAFWQPRGLSALPVEPDYSLTSNNGFRPIEAIATDGSRHAAIVYQPANSVMTVPDAGVRTGAAPGYVLVVLGSWRAPRFVDLGPAIPPFGLAFGEIATTSGLFVLANCSVGSAMPGICNGTPGAVVGFLDQP